MAEKFVCVKTFGVLQTNRNREITRNRYRTVTKGMLLEKISDDSYQFVGDTSWVKLRNSDFCIEIPKTQFVEYFEKASDLP